MSSLNKFELNKLIVSMRHNVNRAKVHIINKLTRQAKKLKTKKASDQLKIKNEKKAERLINEVFVMKKIPSDEVSAFSLSNVKKIDDILKDNESSLRLKALARLSCHSSISPIVQHFRSKYPSWEKEFPTILIALKKGEKLKSKSKNKISGSKMKQENAPEEDSESDRSETEDNLDRMSDDSSSDLENGQDFNLSDCTMSAMTSQDEVIFTKGNRFSVSSDDFNLSDNSLLQNLQEDKSPVKSIISTKDKTKPFPNNNQRKKAESNESISSKNNSNKATMKQPKVKVSHSNQQNNFNIKNNNNSKDNIQDFNIVKRTASPPNPKMKKQVDNFFLVGDNQPYKALEPVFDNNIENTDSRDVELDNLDSDDDNKHDIIKNKNKMKPLNKKKINVNNETKYKNAQKSNKDKKFKNNLLSKAGNKDKIIAGKTEEKLHPSWQAKRKMSSLVNFQGKKITFD